MFSVRLAALSAGLTLFAGCSLLAARGPRLPVADPRQPVECNPSATAARLDVAAGTVLGLLGLVAVASPCDGEGIIDCGDLKAAIAGITLLPAALYLGSGFHGFSSARRCEQARGLQSRCRDGDAEACLALTGGAGIALPDPEARPTGTQTAP